MGTFQNDMRVQAFFQEFPYLSDMVDQRKIAYVRVRRWDTDLLNSTTLVYDQHYYTWDENKFFFLDKDNRVIAIAGKYPETKLPWWNPLSWFTRGNRMRNERILDSVHQLGELATSVTQIVGVHRNCSNDDTVCVYKMPNGVSNLEEWTALTLKKSAQVVQLEVESEKSSN